jgi:hypothetical protein
MGTVKDEKGSRIAEKMKGIRKINRGISRYSYLYLKLAKKAVFLIISYVFSSTKLEKRVEKVLPRSWGHWPK